jgi:DNA-binding phage protein
MELTVDFETGIIEQIRTDQAFTNALLDEVEEVLSEDENEPAQGILRVLVTGTIGFDTLAKFLSMSGQSIQQLLSQEIPPDTTSLKAITKALRLALGVAAS